MPEEITYEVDNHYLDLQRQGQTLQIRDTQGVHFNPFPGLRPFQSNEAHLFFGREGQADELALKMLQQRFVAVVGDSGSGKSSLVRAGLIPDLHGGFNQQYYATWKMAICRPGNHPILNLAVALAHAFADQEADNWSEKITKLLEKLKESTYGLLESQQRSLQKNEKLLIVIDQFEELFRFATKEQRSEVEHFIALLLKAYEVESANIYIVITMRAEFIGDCVQHLGLPEALNKGLFLVPRLSYGDVSRSITGPLGVTGAVIEQTLLNRIMYDYTSNRDQLPLFQHALMRMYHHWQHQEPRPAKIRLEAYEAIGGVSQALNQHAEELYTQLNAKEKEIAKVLFQSLTDLSTGSRGGRRPTRLADVYDLSEAIGGQKVETDKVIEHFRQIGAAFLMPPLGNPLQTDTILDISHESLIANWERLQGWAKEDKKYAQLYLRLNQARENHSRNPELGMLIGEDVEGVEKWWASKEYNQYWAKRYLPNQDEDVFDLNRAHAVKCIVYEKNRARRKLWSSVRKIAIGIMIGVLVVISFLLISTLNLLSRLNSEKYLNDKLRSEEKIQEANELVKSEAYYLANERFKKAFALDPQNKTLQDSISKYQKLANQK